MNKLAVILILVLIAMPVAFAEISSSDKATFDEILEPVMKIYNFVKYSATVLAMLFLAFAGITYIMSGGDTAKREQAKMMATYIIIGLIVIWVAPLLVRYLTQ